MASEQGGTGDQDDTTPRTWSANHNGISGDTSNTEEPRRWPEYRHEDLPVRVDFPASADGDDYTETSSVTTAHFEGAELYGPSMYPSAQSVSDVEDVSVPDINAEAPVEGTDGMGHMGTSVEDMGGTESTINWDDHQLKLEIDKLHNGSAPREEIGTEPPHREVIGGEEPIRPLGDEREDTQSAIHSQDCRLKLETRRLPNEGTVARDACVSQATENTPETQGRSSWISGFLSHPMPACETTTQPPRPGKLGTVQYANKTGANFPDRKASPPTQGSIPLPQAQMSPGAFPMAPLGHGLQAQGRSWLASLLSGPAPLPSENENHNRPPSEPGAFRMSRFGSIPPREPEDHHEEEKGEEMEMVELQPPHAQHQEDPPLDHSRLAQAWPVSELVTATPLNDTQERTDGGRITTKKGTWKLLLFVSLAILAAVVASSVAFPLLLLNKDPDKAQHMLIKSTILDAFGEGYFDNSQKEKALHWIAYEDPRTALNTKETGQPINLIQRFSLASFYFQTSAQQPWTSCNPPLDTQSDTCYYVVGHHREQIGTRWLTAAHECQWMGVQCDGGSRAVTELNLYKNNLHGTIPFEELAVLGQLRKLRLQSNDLAGSIPAKIFQQTSLEYLSLEGNSLTGSIPAQAFLLPSLLTIMFASNRLYGSIPTEIGSFKGKELVLTDNLLTGSIPKEVYTATSLEVLILSNNLLTGNLLPSVGHLAGVLHLSLSGNQIQGTIPSQIGLLGRIRRLSLARTNIDGTLPEELCKNKDLRAVWLSSCSISGTISTRIGELKNLQRFEISNNGIHGTIPSAISSSVATLESLQLHGNAALAGSIPDEFCALRNARCKVTADCTPSASTGFPSVYCPVHCCSMCCDADTEICSEQ